MTDTRTDLPSREEIVERMPRTNFGSIAYRANLALDSLSLLDLAAEMQRRGASVNVTLPPAGFDQGHVCINIDAAYPAPQQEGTVND